MVRSSTESLVVDHLLTGAVQSPTHTVILDLHGIIRRLYLAGRLKS
jgi:hypothetical protein